VYKVSPQSRSRVVNFLTLFFVAGLFFVTPFRAGFSDFMRRFLLFPAVFFSHIDNRLENKKEIQSENQLLKGKVGVLSLEIEKYRDLNAENARLRSLLDLKQKIGFDTVSAEIMSRNPNSWVGSFMINKGKKDGIEEGSAVCSANGLLGKVLEVDDTYSSVILASHPGFKTGGMLKGSRITGIVVGEGAGKIKMLYLPVDAEIESGEEVITSGFSRLFPKGIVIGFVSSVEKSKTGLYKTAIIKPAADPFVQEEVLCMK